MTDSTSAARLRSLMDCVPAGVAIIDGAGCVLEANPRWYALCRDPPCPVGAEWWSVIHPDDHWLLPTVAGATVEVRGLVAGQPRWMSVCVTPVGDGSGAVVALTDIDDAKLDEAEREALHQVADAASRGDDPPGVFARVAKEVGNLVRADGAGVVQFTGSPTTARIVGRWTEDRGLDERTGDELPVTGEGTTARVFATGRPSRVDYADGRAENAPLPHPWRVSAAAPIRVDGRLWGALGVVSMSADRLAADAEERLARFADLVGVAISNAEVRHLLEHQASTDPLTGLAHHGSFHEALVDEVARAGRYGQALSLAIVDIDHFKKVNDTAGHLVGDRTLAAVADLLRSHARTIDVVARVGGEEFAWLMPETAAEGARAAAERLRRAIATADMGLERPLTVSVGVSELSGPVPDAGELYRSADGALYAAKSEGRNRTEVSVPPPVAT